MSTTDEKFETRLLIGTETISGMPDFLRIVLHPVKVTADGTIRNFSTGSWDIEPLADFQLSASVDRSVDSSAPYGWTAEYRNAFSVDLRRAEQMIKLLRKVDRGMEKLRGEWGYPATFPVYVSRVAKIIGATSFGFAVDKGRGWSYDDGEYRWTDVDGMTYRINDIVREHQKVSA